jgi:hypothetical protein
VYFITSSSTTGKMKYAYKIAIKKPEGKKLFGGPNIDKGMLLKRM